MFKCKGKERLFLKIPTFEELDYRKKILADPETMSYNRGCEFCMKGYDNDTGCIDFDEAKWRNWYSTWINNVPDRYYAYVVRIEDNKPIGEVAFRYDEKFQVHISDIIIKSIYRGKDYSEEALNLLINVAFDEYGLERIADNIPIDRICAFKLFIKVGFREKKRINDCMLLELTKDNYLKKHNKYEECIHASLMSIINRKYSVTN